MSNQTTEKRAECPTCKGTGEVGAPWYFTCTRCTGSGQIDIITLNELVQVSNSYTVVLPKTLVIVQHGQYHDLFMIQTDDDNDIDLIWHLYGRETKAQVVAALEVLLNEGETWEPWHVTTAIEEAA